MKIQEIRFHPAFVNGQFHNDLAIIILDGRIAFNNVVQPAILSRERPKGGEILKIYGFGRIGPTNTNPPNSPEIKVADLLVLNTESCTNVLRGFNVDLSKYVPDSIICFASATSNACAVSS